MTSLLTTSPYPWGRPEAVRLQKDLMEAFSEVAVARNIASVAGLNPRALFDQQSVEFACHNHPRRLPLYRH